VIATQSGLYCGGATEIDFINHYAKIISEVNVSTESCTEAILPNSQYPDRNKGYKEMGTSGAASNRKKNTHTGGSFRIHIHIHIYIYMYTCIY